MKKPEKKIKITNKSMLHHNFISNNNVALETFLTWIKEAVPHNAENVRIELSSEDDYDWEGGIVSSTPQLNIAWTETIDNDAYDKQMIKYEKWMKKQNDK